MKKLLSCLLVISVILMGSVNIFAIEDNVITVKVEDYNKFENYEWAPIAEYRIIDVPQNATETKKELLPIHILKMKWLHKRSKFRYLRLLLDPATAQIASYISDGPEHILFL